MDEFPRLNEDLQNINCCVYQIRMSSSYIHEHFQENFQFFDHQEKECLIRIKIQSRHVTSKIYLSWIEYDASAVTACFGRSGSWSLRTYRCNPLGTWDMQDTTLISDFVLKIGVLTLIMGILCDIIILIFSRLIYKYSRSCTLKYVVFC